MLQTKRPPKAVAVANSVWYQTIATGIRFRGCWALDSVQHGKTPQQSGVLPELIRVSRRPRWAPTGYSTVLR